MSVTALIGGSIVLSTPVSAASGHLEKWGWWSESNYVNGVTAPNPAPDAGNAHISYGPEVCDQPDCITNQDPPTGPVEISAVRYTLPNLPSNLDPGTAVANLVLTINGQTAGTPALLMCPTLDPWPAEQSGNWQDKATYGSRGCSPGELSADGTKWGFTAIAGQLKGNVLDVALVPAFTPPSPSSGPSNPPTPPFKVEFNAPTDADLQMISVAAPPPDVTIPQPDSAPAPVTSSGYPASDFGGGAATSTTPVDNSASATAAPAATTTIPPASIPAAQIAKPDQQRTWAIMLLVALLVAGFLAMATDIMRVLTPAGMTVGVGRFARPRTGPPAAL